MVRTFRSLIHASAPYVCVVVLQFLLLYPLHDTMDLPLWDEALYMGMGGGFIHGGTLGPVSGSPIYSLLYAPFVKIFGTISSVFYMQYFVKIGVSTLFLLFLVQRLQSRLLALLLTLIWIVSGVNIWETVLVYHVALGIFLLALIFSNRHRPLTLLLLCLCTLTRLEYLFPTVVYCGYLILTTISGRRSKQTELPSSKAAITLPRFVVFVVVVLLSYVAINVDGWEPGRGRTWFAFSQNYARHEVEAKRYALDPYIDSNIVIQDDFPAANSLTEAFLINPKAFSKHLLRNIDCLPKAIMTFGLPYKHIGTTFGLLYSLLLGTALTSILYAAVNHQRQFLGGGLHVIREQRDVFHLTLMSLPALIPSLFVYATPHYTLIMAPFCLLWLGFGCLHTLKVINSVKFTRWILVVLNSLFILLILVATKPYSSKSPDRPVYAQVTRLIEMWPEGKVRFMGVGASSYGHYIGSQKVLSLEPLATVYGGRIDSGSGNLRTLIERHNPDAVLINKSLVDSKNFDTNSLEVLHSEQWIECPLGSDRVYFLRERLKQCR